MKKTEIIALLVVIAIFVVAVSVLILKDIVSTPEAIEITILFTLVLVTIIYAKRTSDIANATKEQAQEMREQRVMASRPLLIQKSVNEDGFSHFEVYNAGNGTAIEVQVILLDQWGKPRNGKREGFLRAGDTPIKFYTTFPPDVANSTFYIVSEYQGISSYSPQPTWYQTWLPCKLSVSGKVISGKLEFLDEVPEEKRIGIFKSEFNNGRNPK